MGVTIEHWRGAIGRFRGGRSGTSTTTNFQYKQRQCRSAWCISLGLLLLALLCSPLLLTGWSFLPSFNFSSNSTRSTLNPSVQNQEQSVWAPPAMNIELTRFPDFSHADRADFPMVSRKKLNQLARATTGNRSNRGIKLAHWNAGSAHLHNKMDEIEQVVADLHPHVLGISEANFKSEHSIDEVQIQDYDLILSKTVENDQLRVSRVVCYKHQSIVGKVRDDLMDDCFSSIWLELGLPRKKKFLVCQLDREWQYLG